MTKKKLFRVYCVLNVFTDYIMSIYSTYFILWLYNHIGTTEKSIIGAVVCISGCVVSVVMKKRNNIAFLRKHILKLNLMIIIFDIINLIIVLKYQFLAGIFDSLIISTLWILSSNLDADLYNQLYIGKERTLLDQSFMFWNRIAILTGSLTVIAMDILIDNFISKLLLTGICGNLIAITCQTISIKMLEQYIKNKYQVKKS